MCTFAISTSRDITLKSIQIYVHQHAIFKIRRTSTKFMSKKDGLVGRLLWISFGVLQTPCGSSKISLFGFPENKKRGDKHVDPLRTL